jgi:hypothetical protein
MFVLRWRHLLLGWICASQSVDFPSPSCPCRGAGRWPVGSAVVFLPSAPIPAAAAAVRPIWPVGSALVFLPSKKVPVAAAAVHRVSPIQAPIPAAAAVRPIWPVGSAVVFSFSCPPRVGKSFNSFNSFRFPLPVGESFKHVFRSIGAVLIEIEPF